MNHTNQNNLDGKALDGVRYVFLTGKMSPDSQYFELYKNVYKLWSQTWKKAFTDVGSPEAYSADDFYRQDIIPVIAKGNEPLAAHFYTFFHTENPAAMDHHYFEIFPPSLIQRLKSQGVRSLMSMEYLTVNYHYRRSVVGFSLAEVLVSLGARVMQESEVDGAVGVAVKAAGVDQLASKMNYRLEVDNVQRGSLQCCIMSGITGQNEIGVHPDPVIGKFIDQLWISRSYGIFFKENRLKAA